MKFWSEMTEAEQADMKKAVFLSARFGSLDQAIEMLEVGMPPNITDEEGSNLFHYYASHISENYELNAVKLHNAGVDINQLSTKGGGTPLHLAVISDQALAIHPMLKLGADPNKPNRDGTRPIHGTAFQGLGFIRKKLWVGGADETLADGKGKTLDEMAEFGGSVSVLHDFAQFRESETTLPEALLSDERMDEWLDCYRLIGETRRSKQIAWDHFPEIAAKLREAGRPLTLEAVCAGEKSYQSILEQASLSFRLPELMRELHQDGIQIGAETLLDDEGNLSRIGDILVDELDLAHIFTKENWQGKNSTELNRVIQALPEIGKLQVPNAHQLALQISRESARSRER